jgi:hypothetical protein
MRRHAKKFNISMQRMSQITTYPLLLDDGRVGPIDELDRGIAELLDTGDSGILLLEGSVPAMLHQLLLGLQVQGIISWRSRENHALGNQGTYLSDGRKNVGLAVVVTVSSNTKVDLLVEGILRVCSFSVHGARSGQKYCRGS